MQININNSKIGSQTFNEYKNVEIVRQLESRDWDELESFLSAYNKDTVFDKAGIQTISEFEKIVRKKDEAGLKGFIQKNKDNFFTNVMSNVVSSGLLMALQMLVR
ncbi:MAG: hypothetical protein NC321_00275 [Clostridium sp.]|nr:hypothetical protein [Clostridium sp.]